MQIAITGSSGLIGRALAARLEAAGHHVTRVRRDEGSYAWDPATGWIAPGTFEGCDAVVHLAGASIGEGRWTAARKRELRESRIEATRLLVDHLGHMDRPPGVLVCASAVGYYGDRGNEELHEGAKAGEGFLADLVTEWEAEAFAAEAHEMRVVSTRFGVVLSTEGGALSRMLLPVRLGVGGPLGGGQQWMPWVTLEDAVRAIEFALTSNGLRGPVNVVAPHPVRNRDLMRALGRELRRPSLLPTPGFALRLALGEMADELLLGSTRAVPAALERARFEFEHPSIEVALPAVLFAAERAATATGPGR